VGLGDIVGRSGCFSLNLSANSVMRGRVHAIRTLKGLVADLRMKFLRGLLRLIFAKWGLNTLKNKIIDTLDDIVEVLTSPQDCVAVII